MAPDHEDVAPVRRQLDLGPQRRVDVLLLEQIEEAVGPDLASVGDKSTEGLMIAILDDVTAERSRSRDGCRGVTQALRSARRGLRRSALLVAIRATFGRQELADSAGPQRPSGPPPGITSLHEIR